MRNVRNEIVMYIAACSRPPAADNVWYSESKDYYSTGDSVTYYCLNDGVVVGSTTNQCQNGGTWSSTTSPTCETTCKYFYILFYVYKFKQRDKATK